MASLNENFAPLESVLCTEELNRRPSRPPDHDKENRALNKLIGALANSPQTILQTLADTILEVLDCGSAGVSLLSKDGGKRFYWPAIAGSWKQHIGGGTPRDFGPCGDVLDRNATLLFQHLERRYTYFQPVTPLVEEALLVPFYVAGQAMGTIWAVAHEAGRTFDAEDQRQLESMGRFASAAYQAVAAVDASRHTAAIVESSDDAIISKDLNGIIGSWNNSAERLFGYSAKEAIGKHITLIIPEDRKDEETVIIARLRRGERVDHFETVRVRKDGTPLDISLTISPVKDSAGQVTGASKIARDISDRKRAEEARKEAEVAGRLLQVQDAERRRIARELHDGVGQLMTAIAMNVAQVAKEREKLSPEAARCVQDNQGLIAEASREIRTVSYLLHPPMLDEVGLETALRWFADGFSERSKIKVELDIASDIGRLPQDYELSLFRIAQEGLTNVHRHSGGKTAFLRLSRVDQKIELEVRDEGRGLSPEVKAKISAGSNAGVGFRGMQERIKQIGGTLTIESNGHGTVVLASLPVSESMSKAG